MLSYGQSYLPNVLIVKIKESYRGYFLKGGIDDPKLETIFKSCGVKRVTDLQADTFDDFRFWRTTEGWKFYKGSNPNCLLYTSPSPRD